MISGTVFERLKIMMAAVTFDNQSLLITNEVDDERPNRLLASEFCFFEAGCAQIAPELSLGGS